MNNDEIELLIDEDGTKYYVLKNSSLDTFDKNITRMNQFKLLNNKTYYENKLVHREDGPAIEYGDGDKVWIKNGEFHREDGPAIESIAFVGQKHWYRNNKLHREDGPAIEHDNGNKQYYINGIEISEEKFLLEKELRENLINNNINKKNKI